MKMNRGCSVWCCTALCSIVNAQPAASQIAPAGLTVIQNPSGVYYALYADSVRSRRSQFFYVNYATQEFDKIGPSVSSDGTFSGTSSSTGRSLNGQIQSTSISLTYNGVTQVGSKQSLYGPTEQFAGEWLGWVYDPGAGYGYGQFFVSGNNLCFVYFLLGFQYNAGVGTIDGGGFASVPLLSGVSISGTFAPANGVASGTFNYSDGGTNGYSLTKAVTPRLANISTRGVVASGEQVLIGGFIITDGGKTVLITAKGPSLTAGGVSGALQNPQLDLYFNGVLITSNADWQSSSSAGEIAASGLAPTDPREAALQIDLEPGAYTAVVSSEDSSTGVGLVEVYGVGSPVGN